MLELNKVWQTKWKGRQRYRSEDPRWGDQCPIQGWHGWHLIHVFRWGQIHKNTFQNSEGDVSRKTVTAQVNNKLIVPRSERNKSKRIVSRMTLIVSSLHLVCRKKDSLSWKKKGGRRKSKLLAKYMNSFENFHSCFLLSLNTFPTFSDAGKFSMITSHNKSRKWIETRASKLSKYLILNFRHGEARRCAATSMAMGTSWLWGQVDWGGRVDLERQVD